MRSVRQTCGFALVKTVWFGMLRSVKTVDRVAFAPPPGERQAIIDETVAQLKAQSFRPIQS